MRAGNQVGADLRIGENQMVQSTQGSSQGSVQSDGPGVPGWDELVDALRGLPARLLAKLPATMQTDPRIQQEVGRLALAALSASALETLSSDGDHPFFLPLLTMLTFGGQPNPDTFYRFTEITPGGSYRIRGERGTLRIATIGEMSPRTFVNGIDTPMPIHAYHDINALKVDGQGRFDVILSPVRPEGHVGDWWQLSPKTSRLLLRLVNSDWGHEKDPTISIERIDVPAPRPRPSAAELETRLRALPREINFLAPLFVDKVEQLRAEGYVNSLKVFDVSQMGGLKGQFYYEGPYELKDDEALLIEVKAPNCLYRSIMLTNETYDTIDWYNNHSCLNGSQAQVDKDGVLRIVVSASDPGVPNWLATSGHSRGLIQGRWMNADAQPIPAIRKVAFSEIRGLLPGDTPSVTPQQRDQIVRDRRSALQQRTLW